MSSLQDDGDFLSEEVRVGAVRVQVGGYRADGCRTMPVWATMDGVRLGAADRTTWALDPADTDHDGVVPECDCDDADPSVNPYAADPDADGVDQDCDGTDGPHERTDTGGDTADTAGDTADDTAEPAGDTASADGPPPEPPIASWTEGETAGCGVGGAAWLLAVPPLLRRRRAR